MSLPPPPPGIRDLLRVPPLLIVEQKKALGFLHWWTVD